MKKCFCSHWLVWSVIPTCSGCKKCCPYISFTSLLLWTILYYHHSPPWFYFLSLQWVTIQDDYLLWLFFCNIVLCGHCCHQQQYRGMVTSEPSVCRKDFNFLLICLNSCRTFLQDLWNLELFEFLYSLCDILNITITMFNTVVLPWWWSAG